jgi:hypothetical protein
MLSACSKRSRTKVRDLLGIVTPVQLREEPSIVGGPVTQSLKIRVDPSPTPISSRGEYYIRSGSAKQQLTGSALSAFSCFASSGGIGTALRFRASLWATSIRWRSGAVASRPD